MVNESGNADVSVEKGRQSVGAESPCARRRRRRAHGPRARLGLADGRGRLDHAARPTSGGHCVYRRLRRDRVGSHIGGLCCRPRPFSVCRPHDCRIRFFFDVYHLHRPSSVRYRFRCRCRGGLAVCPAPRILGGPGVRLGLHRVGGHRRDDCDTYLYHHGHGAFRTSPVKESVVALLKRKWLM